MQSPNLLTIILNNGKSSSQLFKSCKNRLQSGQGTFVTHAYYFTEKNEFCSFLIQIFYYFKVMERTPLESKEQKTYHLFNFRFCLKQNVETESVERGNWPQMFNSLKIEFLVKKNMYSKTWLLNLKLNRVLRWLFFTLLTNPKT